MKKNKIKFSFAPDFQLEILRFIIQDKEGGTKQNKTKLLSTYRTFLNM